MSDTPNSPNPAVERLADSLRFWFDAYHEDIDGSDVSAFLARQLLSTTAEPLADRDWLLTLPALQDVRQLVALGAVFSECVLFPDHVSLDDIQYETATGLFKAIASTALARSPGESSARLLRGTEPT